MRRRLGAFRSRLDRASQAAGERLYRIADAVAGAGFRDEVRAAPGPITIDGRQIDPLEDLAAYTDLDRETVEFEVLRRRHINFRNEWLATPREVRVDHWFYLSSRTYLFANAAHFTDESLVRGFIARHVGPGQRALDFGGGSGELALRLAALGVRTTFVELSALQRDFMRFRIVRHDLGDLIEVVDPWTEVPRDAFDAVLAFDVIEHLPDAYEVLEAKLLPALRPAGVLIEASPFGAEPANPMHHGDFGFDAYMQERGFRVVDDAGLTRAWRRT